MVFQRRLVDPARRHFREADRHDEEEQGFAGSRTGESTGARPDPTGSAFDAVRGGDPPHVAEDGLRGLTRDAHHVARRPAPRMRAVRWSQPAPQCASLVDTSSRRTCEAAPASAFRRRLARGSGSSPPRWCGSRPEDRVVSRGRALLRPEHPLGRGWLVTILKWVLPSPPTP